MSLNRKLIRRIRNFFCQRKLIISINNQLSDPITPVQGVTHDSPLSPILFILYVIDIPQPFDAQVNFSQCRQPDQFSKVPGCSHWQPSKYETKCEKHWKGIPYKQDENYKVKFNQCYPTNPSLQDIYKTVNGQCMYGSRCT